MNYLKINIILKNSRKVREKNSGSITKKYYKLIVEK